MTLEEIIVARIQPAMLERVVHDQDIVDASKRTALFKASGLSWQEIAKQTVEAYGARAPRLASGLYNQVSESDWEIASLLFAHFQSAKQENYNHQASLVGRIPTLELDKLNEFLKNIRLQLCLIICRKGAARPRRGTGFLIGPSLVLTCEHVLTDFWACKDDALPEDGSIELYFDFHEGGPIESLGVPLPGTRKVGLQKAWRLEKSRHAAEDGLVGALDPVRAEAIAKSRDFVLLQLDQPVGRQPRVLGGGRRRGWVNLTADAVSQNLQADDWIIIPQHPHGFPQRIDLGRFTEPDDTKTRIRYLTNTAKGTSGAPCFNQKFELVGVHNAYVGPDEKPLANQAIRLDRIAPLVRPHTTNLERDYVLRWSISDDVTAPCVVLGRKVLLEWLRDSAVIDPAHLAHRVYAALASDSNAGCSFSLDALHAETRGSKIPRAVYGKRGQQLPDTPEDFLRSLLRELGIKMEDAEVLPARPVIGANAPLPIAGEVDKLDLWLADDLPSWLSRVITAHVERTIDIRSVAQQQVHLLEQAGLEVAKQLRDQAESKDPINVRPNAWDFAYVVIDDLRVKGYQAKAGEGEKEARTELKGEVLKLIAAIVKGNPEQTMEPGLRRLRWMFLGYLPDFIRVADVDGNGATVERLDPATVKAPEVLEVFDRMSQTHLPMQDVPAFAATATAETCVELTDSEAATEPRLARLQAKVNLYTKKLLQEMSK